VIRQVGVLLFSTETGRDLFIKEKIMRHYYPNIDPPWEDDEVDDEALYDAEESYKENLAMEEYYEEKYG